MLATTQFAWLGGAMVFVLALVVVVAIIVLVVGYFTGWLGEMLRTSQETDDVARALEDDGHEPRPVSAQPASAATEGTRFVDVP